MNMIQNHYSASLRAVWLSDSKMVNEIIGLLCVDSRLLLIHTDCSDFCLLFSWMNKDLLNWIIDCRQAQHFSVFFHLGFFFICWTFWPFLPPINGVKERVAENGKAVALNMCSCSHVAAFTLWECLF